MAESTAELELFKYDEVADASQVFSFEQALNDNWDKIDAFAGAIKSLSNLDAEGEKRFEDIWTELDKKLEAEVLLSENGYIKFNNSVIIQWVSVSIAKNTSNQLYTYPISSVVYSIVVSSYTASTVIEGTSSSFNMLYATSTSQTSTQARIISTSYATNVRSVRVIIIGKKH